MYASTENLAKTDAALLAIMRAAGTRSSKRSLYGGAGGSTDQTNPGNPRAQALSRTSNKLMPAP
jgi:hypothetical protein